VYISSIQDIFVEDEDKQVGGTAMTLGKTAAPFGGGVVSLFAHKKYDFLAVEYLDNNDGFHGAIFQLDKGQGQPFKRDLVANGAHITPPTDRAATQSTPEVKHENK
jgi:predicted phage tail protein